MFKLDIIEFDENIYTVTGKKTFKNIEENDSLSRWVERPKCTVTYPQCKSPLDFVCIPPKIHFHKLSMNSIGFCNFMGNFLGRTSLRGIYTVRYWDGWAIEPKNFIHTCICLASSLSIDVNWINEHDQLKIPTNSKPEVLKKFAANSIIFTLFNGQNQTVSVNNIPYNNTMYDMRNQFFWFSPEEFLSIKDLPQVLYNDAKKQYEIEKKQSFVSSILPKLDRSLLFPEAIEVLELQKELVKLTASKRTATDPKFQLHRYDAGWYQIRMGILNDLLKQNKQDPISLTFIKFKETYKKLKYQLQPMVYELEVLEKETML